MDNYFLKSIPPQSASVYKILEDRKPRSAKDIGKRLHILPNAVYRSIKQLLDLGFVERVVEYPVKFRAKSADEAMSLYSSIVLQNFQEVFKNEKIKLSTHSLMQLVFIHSRKDLLKYTGKDIPQAKSTINLIASGLEVPAEIVLGYKRAVERGVRVRFIVQNLKEVRKEMIQSFKKAGVEVKYYPTIESRIFVFDHRVVYFTSYNPANINEATGIRFAYAPFAKLMDELFEQRWQLAKEVPKH